MVGIGAVGAKLHSRLRSQALCDDVPCVHQFVRTKAVESVIAQRGSVPSYLVLGDSFAELADLPMICGRAPINAGIGGATTRTFLAEAHRFADLANPDFIIITLGTNDALTGQTVGFRERYETILTSLTFRKTIVVPVPPSPKIPNVRWLNGQIAALSASKASPLKHVETLDDGIHLSASSYSAWKQSIIDAVTKTFCG